MTDPKTRQETAADDDVSPMEAQNIGPEKTGPAERPLRQDRPAEPTGAPESPETPIGPGGETATRDDL